MKGSATTPQTRGTSKHASAAHADTNLPLTRAAAKKCRHDPSDPYYLRLRRGGPWKCTAKAHPRPQRHRRPRPPPAALADHRRRERGMQPPRWKEEGFCWLGKGFVEVDVWPKALGSVSLVVLPQDARSGGVGGLLTPSSRTSVVLCPVAARPTCIATGAPETDG